VRFCFTCLRDVYYETAEEYNRAVAGFLAEHKLMPAL
jgi:hypothetical protein